MKDSSATRDWTNGSASRAWRDGDADCRGLSYSVCGFAVLLVLGTRCVGDFGSADAVASWPPGEQPSFGAAGSHAGAVAKTDRYARDARTCPSDDPRELMRAFASGRDPASRAAVDRPAGSHGGRSSHTYSGARRAAVADTTEADGCGPASFCLQEDQRVGATRVDEDRAPGIDWDRRRSMSWSLCRDGRQEMFHHPNELRATCRACLVELPAGRGGRCGRPSGNARGGSLPRSTTDTANTTAAASASVPTASAVRPADPRG